jgi:signal recognition particle subunit SRP54
VLIVDTAGRLHVDAAMMDEIKVLHAALDPIETLFVVDSMTGQDAANTAKAFADALPLTGVVLTKTDGDARGGAALSVRYVTGRPIKFIGVSEKPDGLEPFHPDRIATRILGMGDVLSLVEQVEQSVDQEKQRKLAEKVIKGKRFDLNDMRDQLEQMVNMGGMASLMDKLPGVSNLPDHVKAKANDGEVKRMIAIIGSMTKKERRHPDLLNGSRRARRAWLGHAAGRRQPPAQAVPADGKDDVQARQRRPQGPDAPDGLGDEGHGRRRVHAAAVKRRLINRDFISARFPLEYAAHSGPCVRPDRRDPENIP